MYEASPPSRPYCVSTISHSSLFTKRKCNSHSSFFILHSSFYILHSTFFILHSSFFILHSSFKKSPVSGALPPDIFPIFLLFPLTHINEKTNNAYFSKKYPQKFW